MPQSLIKRFHNVILEFVWKGKKHKISHKILSATKLAGGLRLINIEYKHKAILINWIHVLNRNVFFRECFNEYCIELPHDYIWQINLHKSDCHVLLTNAKERSIWSDLLYCWCELHYNSSLKTKKTVVVYRQLISKRILFVKDIVKDGSLMNYEDFVSTYGHLITWLEYNSLIQKIAQNLLLCIQKDTTSVKTLYDDFISRKNGTKVYIHQNGELKC